MSEFKVLEVQAYMAKNNVSFAEAVEHFGLSDVEAAAMAKELAGDPGRNEDTFTSQNNNVYKYPNKEIFGGRPWEELSFGEKVVKGILRLVLLPFTGLTSCTPINIEGDNNVINIGVVVESGLEDAIKDLIAQQNANHEELMELLNNHYQAIVTQNAKLDDIIKSLTQLGVKLDDVVELLTSQGKSLDEIVEVLTQNGKTLTEITEALKNNGKTQTEILAAVKELFTQGSDTSAKLDRIIAAVEAGNVLSEESNKLLMEVLDKLNSFDPHVTKDIKDVLNLILDQITKGAEAEQQMDEKTLAILQTISDTVVNLGQKMDDNTKEVIAAIVQNYTTLEGALKENAELVIKELNKNNEIDNEILQVVKSLQTLNPTVDLSGVEDLIEALTDKVNEFMTQEKDMDTKTATLLQSILDNMQNFNADMKTGFGDVIAKLDKLTPEQKDILEALAYLTKVVDGRTSEIIEAIKNGEKADAEHFEALRALIEENNNIAQGTQNLVKELNGKADALGTDVKAILDKLGNVSGGNVTVDLSEITTLLKAIKDDTAKNGETLVRIEDKLALAAVTLDTILTTVEGIGDDTKAVLLKILAKIPDGCKCETVDLTVVINKLDKIIEEIKKNPSGNHEGILDDFEETMNGLV